MQNRRRFIKNSLLAVTGAGFAGSLYFPEEQLTRNLENKFIYRTLGKTGIKLPVVSMGTNNTSNPALIRTALEKGIKLLATAGAYQNGNNEKMIGSVIKDLPRDSYLILTNSFDINWIETKTGIMNSAFTYDKLLKNVKESLSRLGVNYVDIFTQPFAATRESVFHEPVIKAMEALKKEGLTRFIGIATHRSEPETVRAAADAGIHDVIMTSYNFLKTNREDLDDAIRYAANTGLGIIAMKTMAGAYWDKERASPINTRAALKWVLHNTNIHTSVPDCGDFNQLNQDLEIMSDLQLTEDEIKDLKPPSGANVSGLYCQQCGECLAKCPHGVDIPTFMRSYMYAFGYNNVPYAQQTISDAGFNTNPCSGCTTCNVSCTMGFNIKKKIMDIFKVTNEPYNC
ncbi:MAG TPA: aldo/keto reductase [Bacteroidales bacterium]|nr:aldo/keto reductase [Bacteroidales bacterium]